jgi:hypothetical protein
MARSTPDPESVNIHDLNVPEDVLQEARRHVVSRAGSWRGTSRFSLAAAGLFIPLVMIPAMFMPGLWFHYAIGLWGLTFLWVAATLPRTEWR